VGDGGQDGRRAGRLGWRELERELLQACGVFDLYRSRRRAEDGREGDFYILGSRDWVNVVPVLHGADGERFLMVRQYRQGLDSLTVEFPAGLIEPGESPLEAAGRELVEETGFAAGSLVLIGTISPNPSFMGNRCFTYLAEGLRESGAQQLDELELLEVLHVPVAELTARIGNAPYLNAMTALALFWYLRLAPNREDSARQR
jgi:ADP-ribose pyrophosphatase